MNDKLYTRKTVLAAGALGVAGATVAGKYITDAVSNASLAPYVWSRPVVNGGFCNVIAADPNQTGRFYAGGDMYGMHRSEDVASSWIPTMWGATSIGDTYGRAVRASLLHPGTAYYGIGTLKGGNTSGSFAVCSGFKVEYRSKAIGFGTALPSGSGGGLPRPLGNLIDIMLSSGSEVLFAASNRGIASSLDEGHTWKIYSGTGGVIYKSIAMIDATTALASVWNKSVLTLVKNGVVSHPASPGTIHDLRNIGGTVWGVGPTGIYQWNGTALVKHPSSSFFAGTIPSAIDGVGQTLVVGTNTIGSKSAAISHDGGTTWRWITGAQQTLWNGNAYWLASAGNGFNSSHYSVSQIAIDKQNPNNIMFAGRNGVWGTRDGGLTLHPCGPGGSEVQTMKVGPGPSEFSGNDNDWTGIHTTNNWQTMNRLSSAPGGSTSLNANVGGHAYSVHKGTTCDITKDGQSIATDYFRGAAALSVNMNANAAGVVSIGQYGGSILTGHP